MRQPVIGSDSHPRFHVVSIISLCSVKGKGCSRLRNRAADAGQSWYQQLDSTIPRSVQGVQHLAHRRIATHPAGYGRALFGSGVLVQLLRGSGLPFPDDAVVDMLGDLRIPHKETP